MTFRSIIGCALVFVSFAGTCAQPPSSPLDSVVRLEVQLPDGAGWGSGFVVNREYDRVYVLTNAHNFTGFRRGVDACTVYPPKHPPIRIDNIHYMGNLDAGEDLALISGITKSAPQPLELFGGELKPGDSVNLVGYPGGKSISVRPATRTKSMMTVGRYQIDHFDQPVDQGMSGGPVIIQGQAAALIFGTEQLKPASVAVKIGPIRRVMARVFPKLAARWRNRSKLASCVGACQPPSYPRPKIPQGPGQITQAPQPIPQPAPTYNGLPIEGPDLSGYVRREELKQYAKRGDLKPFVTGDQVNGRLNGYARSDQVESAVSTLRERLQQRIESRFESVLGTTATETNWLEAIKQIAEYFGLSIAVPGGVFGVVGFKVLQLWLRHRIKPARGPTDPFEADDRQMDHGGRQKTVDSQKSHAQVSNSSSDPGPAKPETVTRTTHEIVRVPTTNREAEAINEAMAREAKAFPQHAPIISRLRSVASQILHGDGVKSAGRGETEEKRFGVGWSD